MAEVVSTATMASQNALAVSFAPCDERRQIYVLKSEKGQKTMELLDMWKHRCRRRRWHWDSTRACIYKCWLCPYSCRRHDAGISVWYFSCPVPYGYGYAMRVAVSGWNFLINHENDNNNLRDSVVHGCGCMRKNASSANCAKPQHKTHLRNRWFANTKKKVNSCLISGLKPKPSLNTMPAAFTAAHKWLWWAWECERANEKL